MSSDSRKTRDISVLQLLTKLARETDRLVRLADDIDTYAVTPQAKAAFNLIGSEVNNILGIIRGSVEPLYKLYELDPGMKNLDSGYSSYTKPSATKEDVEKSYDEQALWSDIEKQ